MDGERLDVGEILQRSAEIFRLSTGAVLAYIGVVSAASIAADLFDPEGGAQNFLVSIIGIAAGFLMMRAVVRNASLTKGFEQGFGAYFGLSILTSLGLALGFVFLVIPGVVLLVRWLPAFAVLMSEEDATVTGAMGKSWDMTAGHFWPLLAAVLIGVVLMGIALLAYVSPDLGYDVSFELAAVTGNILLSCGSAYFTVLGVAAYSLLRTEHQGLGEIFA